MEGCSSDRLDEERAARIRTHGRSRARPDRRFPFLEGPGTCGLFPVRGRIFDPVRHRVPAPVETFAKRLDGVGAGDGLGDVSSDLDRYFFSGLRQLKNILIVFHSNIKRIGFNHNLLVSNLMV